MASYVKAIRGMLEQGYNLFVEGETRTDDPKHFELRIDGPYVTPIGSKGEYKAYIEVNILGNCTRDESNRYSRENQQGLSVFMLNRDFCIYRTGNQEKNDADDGSFIETMRLLPKDKIKLSDFGQIDNDTEIYQSVAEAHYEMLFTEDF